MARPQTARKIPRSWTKKMSETEAVAREKMGAAAKPVNVRATTRIGNVYCGKSWYFVRQRKWWLPILATEISKGDVNMKRNKMQHTVAA